MSGRRLPWFFHFVQNHFLHRSHRQPRWQRLTRSVYRHQYYTPRFAQALGPIPHSACLERCLMLQARPSSHFQNQPPSCPTWDHNSAESHYHYHQSPRMISRATHSGFLGYSQSDQGHCPTNRMGQQHSFAAHQKNKHLSLSQSVNAESVHIQYFLQSPACLRWPLSHLPIHLKAAQDANNKKNDRSPDAPV